MDLNDVASKIKRELGIDIVSTELEGVYDEVKKFIARVHPDRFTDEELRQENVGKTQAATIILTELKKEIERKRIQETAIVPYDEARNSIDNYEYKIIIKENELFQLKATLRERDEEIASLREQIKELEKIGSQIRATQITTEKDRVVNSFKPKQPTIVTAGTVATLIIVYNILGQVEGVSKKLTAYLPVPEIAANIVLFSSLAITVAFIGYKSLRASAVRKYLDSIITQTNIAAIGSMVENGIITRQQIHDYFVNQLKVSTGIRKFQNRLWSLSDSVIVEEAINMIVDYMIGNSYIEKINVKNLVQNYRVMELTLWDVYLKSRKSEG